MTDDQVPAVIRLPTAQDNSFDGLNRFARETEREKIDAMFARIERGEVSEEECQLIQQDQARRAFGIARPSTDSLPPWIQPAVRKVLEQE